MSHPVHNGRRLDGPEWRARRAAYLRDHPACSRCGRPADVVDHKQAHHSDPLLFWSQANWQSLCVQCHNAKTMAVDMARSKRTDNSFLRTKLELRRYFLRRYHAAGPTWVMDCCQGEGRIWDVLRREFAMSGYWGIDTKPKAGRLLLDSSRILAQPGWRENVIDVDTYGDPWKHWLGVCCNLDHPATVFLTVGYVPANGQGSISMAAKEALGLLGLKHLPNALVARVHDMATPYCLNKARARLNIVELCEAEPHGRYARYIGVRLEPK
jgi:hypothetical protein